METYLYTCKHCYKEFRPTRRVVQKFCSDSCRVGHHQHHKRLQQKMQDSLAMGKDTVEEIIESDKKESMSLAGIGNAAIGSLAVDAAIALFTKEGDKPASKADIKELKDLINKRYFAVHNIRPDGQGRKPFFDMRTGKIVYHNLHENRFDLPFMDLSQ